MATNHGVLTGASWAPVVDAMMDARETEHDTFLFTSATQLHHTVWDHMPDNDKGCPSCTDRGCPVWAAAQRVMFAWLRTKAGV